jgi:hypothetical protein
VVVVVLFVLFVWPNMSSALWNVPPIARATPNSVSK